MGKFLTEFRGETCDRLASHFGGGVLFFFFLENSNLSFFGIFKQWVHANSRLPDTMRHWTKHTHTYPHRKFHSPSIGPHLSLLSCCTFSQQILSIHTPCGTPVGIRYHRHFHRPHSPVCRLWVPTIQNIEELK